MSKAGEWDISLRAANLQQRNPMGPPEGGIGEG